MYIKVVESEYNKSLKKAYARGFLEGNRCGKDDKSFKIDLNLGDLVKNSDNELFEILSLRNYGRGYLTVVLINRYTREDFEVGLYNFKTDYKLITDFDVSKRYVEGRDYGFKEGDNTSYNKGFEDGKVVKERKLKGNMKTKYCVEEDKKPKEDFGKYQRGYEDGKSIGFTLGYNKRVYEKKNNCVDDIAVKEDSERKHSHYFKDVRHLDFVDIYQVCKLFPVDDDSGAIVHARKKLLVAGGRGAGKDMIKDITEARDTLNRYLQIEGYE